MRPVRVVVSAPGPSQWIPVNYLQTPFGVGLVVIPWATATGLTYVVQHVFDDISISHGVAITRAAAVATVVDNGPDGLGHGLSTGDSALIQGSGSETFDSPEPVVGMGEVGSTITPTGNNTYSYPVPNSAPVLDQ